MLSRKNLRAVFPFLTKQRRHIMLNKVHDEFCESDFTSVLATSPHLTFFSPSAIKCHTHNRQGQHLLFDSICTLSTLIDLYSTLLRSPSKSVRRKSINFDGQKSSQCLTYSSLDSSSCWFFGVLKICR